MKSLREALVHKHMDGMKTIELQDGDVVVLRNGSYMVTDINPHQTIHSLVPPGSKERIILLKSYNSDLTHSRCKDWDIMIVYRFTDSSAIDPRTTYRSPDLESFVHRNLKGIIHYGINTVFKRK